MPSAIVTLDQKRARHAWEVVEKVSASELDNFQTQAKKLPTRILTSGLGQALAFVEVKKDAPAIVAALADWLDQRKRTEEGKSTNVVQRIIHGDALFLRFATAESLAYLQWVVRFAEARDKAPGPPTS